MAELYKPGLDILQPAASWRERVSATTDALFTCREGGVSSGPWGDARGVMGLNVAPHTGDFGACVRMNRDIVAQLVPSDPVWLEQVHGTTIVHADDWQGAKEPPAADASWTMTPGVVCTVMVADCLPVLLSDDKGRIVAAVHAGWRSLAAGILQKTVVLMRERLDAPTARLAAWLGPRIGALDFEVGEDVRDAMAETFPAEVLERAFVKKENGRYLADLAGLAASALEASGLADADIVDCGLSTYANAERFYSFRRDGEKSGRHAVMIWLKPAEGAESAEAAPVS